MPGYTGKILRVNLTSNEIETENLDPAVIKDYIGGRGLGIYYLNRELDPKCDPLAAENMLILLTGPLTGTRAPTGSRYMVMTKSPLTGALTSSNAGGFFPTEMKRVGFDGMIITGCSDQPVYLWVGDGKIELRPAAHLWGKPTDETTDLLLAETDPKARVACIGPAGENLVRFAAIMSDKGRAAGRSGVGAVMGSKNLKAIVVRGKGKLQIHDEAKFSSFNKDLLKVFKTEAERHRWA
jgi:aldehyde:ferredoxin oxidoreductase